MKEVISWIREKDEEFFQRSFAPYPDLRVWNLRTEKDKTPEKMDALLLTGGSDISLDFLRQPVPDPSLIHDADPERDALEFPLLERALAAKLPVLAICRGFQVLNVARGGTLHLDIPGHDHDRFNNVQKLQYEPDATLRIPQVNSSHHQALDRLGDGIKVVARHEGDGIIEQVRLENYPSLLAVQYHPERHELYQPLFDFFAGQVRKS
jgi:putative glutamine amidotransferase